MSNLINGKTPEEIKSAIEKCVDGNCNGCAYYDVMGCSTAKSYDALAYIERLEAAQPKWISVEDEKPEPFVSVQVYMPGEAPHPTVREGFITEDGVWYADLYDREPDEVTHWKPMSEPPEVEG